MCLAIPARVIELQDDIAIVDAMGNRFRGRTTLQGDVKIGILVLVHAGFGISTVGEEEARKTWQLIAEIDDFDNTSSKISG